MRSVQKLVPARLRAFAAEHGLAAMLVAVTAAAVLVGVGQHLADVLARIASDVQI